jgi:hypothetical protein
MVLRCEICENHFLSMEKPKINWRQLTWLVLFSIAMGFLETAVVVYLRKIYYPEGFRFPLTAMDPHMVMVEVLREASTVIMLAGIAILSGRSLLQRLAFFLASFAIWDLFYYIFLKLLLDWPASLFTWDILFLIPVPWVGPVLTPCLVSITMLLLAAALYYRDVHQAGHRILLREWALFILGSQIVILSWTWDYFRTARQDGLSFFYGYIPSAYSWWMFAVGECVLLISIFLFWKRTSNLVMKSAL